MNAEVIFKSGKISHLSISLVFVTDKENEFIANNICFLTRHNNSQPTVILSSYYEVIHIW